MKTEITKTTSFEIALTEFKQPYEKELAEFKKKYTGVVYDLNDAENEKQARADRLAIGKVVSKLDKAHRAIKAPMETEIKLLDSTRKTIKDDLLEIQEGIKAQLKTHDEKIVRHCASLQKKVDDITAIAVLDEDNPNDLGEMLNQAKAVVVDESFENREADGHMAKAKTIQSIEGHIALYEKQVKEARKASQKAEAEATLAAQEREKEIREEMQAKAEKDAEKAAQKVKDDAKAAKLKAEQEKKDAATKVEQDRIEAENKAVATQQAAVKEAQDKMRDKQNRLDEEARNKALEATKEAAELKKKQANKSHQAKVHNEAKLSLMEIDFDDSPDEIAFEIVKAIVRGQVKNVYIQY